MNAPPTHDGTRGNADRLVESLLAVVEYAIVVSLMVIAATELGRTIYNFFAQWHDFPQSVVGAIDGILVVIILIDIARTVLAHLRLATFPVRPFLVIGILAGVRDILSASARLTFGQTLQGVSFAHTMISLALGVGVVLALSFSLLLLRVGQRAR